MYADGLIQWNLNGAVAGYDDGDNSGSGSYSYTYRYTYNYNNYDQYDDGDGENFFNIPGSRTPEIINITQTSNVDNPGMWIFITTRQGVPIMYIM